MITAIKQLMRFLASRSVGPEHGYTDLPGPASVAELARLYCERRLPLPLAVDLSTLLARMYGAKDKVTLIANYLATLLAEVKGPVLLWLKLEANHVGHLYAEGDLSFHSDPAASPEEGATSFSQQLRIKLGQRLTQQLLSIHNNLSVATAGRAYINVVLSFSGLLENDSGDVGQQQHVRLAYTRLQQSPESQAFFGSLAASSSGQQLASLTLPSPMRELIKQQLASCDLAAPPFVEVANDYDLLATSVARRALAYILLMERAGAAADLPFGESRLFVPSTVMAKLGLPQELMALAWKACVASDYTSDDKHSPVPYTLWGELVGRLQQWLGSTGDAAAFSLPQPWLALPCPALRPCPAPLPSPARPCPAQPCPALDLLPLLPGGGVGSSGTAGAGTSSGSEQQQQSGVGPSEPAAAPPKRGRVTRRSAAAAADAATEASDSDEEEAAAARRSKSGSGKKVDWLTFGRAMHAFLLGQSRRAAHVPPALVGAGYSSAGEVVINQTAHHALRAMQTALANAGEASFEVRRPPQHAGKLEQAAVVYLSGAHAAMIERLMKTV